MRCGCRMGCAAFGPARAPGLLVSFAPATVRENPDALKRCPTFVPSFPGSPYREDLFAGQTALVTGGATGMGKSIAHAFAAHGADVHVASRNEEHLTSAAAEIERATGRRVHWHRCDVREAEQVDAMFASLDKLDHLVNSAAGNFLVPFDQMSRN